MVCPSATARIDMDIAHSPTPTARGMSLTACCLIFCFALALLAGPTNAQASAERLNINSASAAELAQTLPGIGPVKALRIVEHREQSGAFNTVEALVDVKGIGPRTLDKLRSLITVGAELESRAQAREAEVTEAVRRVIARAQE